MRPSEDERPDRPGNGNEARGEFLHVVELVKEVDREGAEGEEVGEEVLEAPDAVVDLEGEGVEGGSDEREDEVEGSAEVVPRAGVSRLVEEVEGEVGEGGGDGGEEGEEEGFGGRVAPEGEVEGG